MAVGAHHMYSRSQCVTLTPGISNVQAGKGKNSSAVSGQGVITTLLTELKPALMEPGPGPVPGAWHLLSHLILPPAL